MIILSAWNLLLHPAVMMPLYNICFPSILTLLQILTFRQVVSEILSLLIFWLASAFSISQTVTDMKNT